MVYFVLLICIVLHFLLVSVQPVHSFTVGSNQEKIKKVVRGHILKVQSYKPYLGVGISFNRKWRVTKDSQEVGYDSIPIC